ncbi:MAG TPA: SMI1/KNR4 family protein [Sphingomonadaceae bacterium]|jgi:cell wall assembly regulator SMI1|nr:SMI1/KNR4 family protein [Sphingomonadaceae bacterium]
MEIENAGPPLSVDRLALVESQVGVEFPQDYKEFLLRHNGGEPTPSYMAMPAWTGKSTDVNTFFGIDCQEDYNDLLKAVELMREGYPEDAVLPVAYDSSGNIFCIIGDRRSRGSIVMYEIGGAHHEGYNPIAVADSFTAFLGMLRDDHS